MSFQSIMFNIGATINDYKRDKAIPLPAGITECRNISYGCHGKWNLLDVYYPDDATESLPTIVSIHGGGYVYGTKEIYRRYGMDLAWLQSGALSLIETKTGQYVYSDADIAQLDIHTNQFFFVFNSFF